MVREPVAITAQTGKKKGGEQGKEHDGKYGPEPIRCMSGDVAVTARRVNQESFVGHSCWMWDQGGRR